MTRDQTTSIVDGVNLLTEGLEMVAAIARSAKLALLHPQRPMSERQLAAVLEAIESIAETNLDIGQSAVRSCKVPELCEALERPDDLTTARAAALAAQARQQWHEKMSAVK